MNGSRKNLQNPLEVYYKMDDVTLMYLLRNCHHIFQGQEYSDVEKFVDRHKDDGVLLLKATYKIQVLERAKVEKKIVSSASTLERKKGEGDRVTPFSLQPVNCIWAECPSNLPSLSVPLSQDRSRTGPQLSQRKN